MSYPVGKLAHVDTDLLRLARLHGGVVLGRDALAQGYSPASIQRRVAEGFLVPIFPGSGTYVLASTPIERRHRVIAATMIVPDAAADGEDAAVLLGLLPPRDSDDAKWPNQAEPVQIALPTPARVRTAGIVVRRQLHRDETDLVRRVGINVVSPARLVLDMAGRWPPRRTEHLLDTALSSGVLDLGDVVRRHQQLNRRGRKGVAVVDALVERRLGATRGSNALERRAIEMIVGAGLRAPVRQHRVVLPTGKRRFIDLAYPAERVGIEVDGYRWHSAHSQWAADQVRSNELVGLGWRLLRVTDETINDPVLFLRQLATLIACAA